MEPMTLAQIGRASGATLLDPAGAAVVATGVSTDTRTLVPGDLFVAMEGARFDGHRFVPEAFRRGAVAAIVRRDGAEREGSGGRRGFLLACDDPLEALGRLGRTFREMISARVIAVTGSVGKSTTKEILAALLGSEPQVVRAEHSFNNAIGVPKTLLRATSATRFIVCELGTSAPGEIAHLASLCRPDIGAITRVAPAHVEGLGSLEGVRREKAALACALGDSGPLFTNGDCPDCRRIAREHAGPVVLVGSRSSDVDLEASNVTFDGEAIAFDCRDGHHRGSVRVPLAGRHHVTNVLIALAIGSYVGLSWAEMIDRLGRVERLPGRLESAVAGGVRLIDDAFNASPAAVDAAIDVLRETPAARRILVLGAMRELGGESREHHRAAGRAAAAAGIDALVALGADGVHVAEGARAAGLPAARVHAVAGGDEALSVLLALLSPGDVCLFKASHAVGLGAVVARLRDVLARRAAA